MAEWLVCGYDLGYHGSISSGGFPIFALSPSGWRLPKYCSAVAVRGWWTSCCFNLSFLHVFWELKVTRCCCLRLIVLETLCCLLLLLVQSYNMSGRFSCSLPRLVSRGPYWPNSLPPVVTNVTVTIYRVGWRNRGDWLAWLSSCE